MKNFTKLFFSVLDQEDQKAFKKYVLVLFFCSTLSVLGIGAVIPFINVLMQPEKVMSFSLFQHWQYHKVVLSLTFLLIAAFAVKNITAFFLYRYQSHFLFGLIAKIQKRLFSGYMSVDYECHLSRNTANLIKVINNETNLLAICVIAPLGLAFTEIFSSGFVVLLLLWINPIFTTAVVLSLSVSIVLFTKIIRKKLKKFADMRTKAWSEMTESVLNGLSGIKETKLYHSEPYYIKTFSKEASTLRHSWAFQYTYSQAPRMMIEFVGLTIVMMVLCIMLLLGHDSKQLFVLMGVFGIAAAQLLPSLNRLTQSLVQIRYGMPALKTIKEELNLISRKRDYDVFKKKSVEKFNFSKEIFLKNISYAYADGTKALSDLTVKIPKGKKIAFVGVSGAGKTTLVDLLMGLYRAQKGEVYVDGVVLKNEKDFLGIQKLFGYIPQAIPLFDKSIAENIALGIEKERIDNDRVWQCLEMAQLKEFVESLEKNIESTIGEGGIRLSGGQRQRLGIARALYRNPEILVMDEATSALDNRTEKSVTDVVLNLKDITVVTIAHRLTTIEGYDLIYVLDKGKVVGCGSYAELSATCEYFKCMLVKGDTPEIQHRDDCYA